MLNIVGSPFDVVDAGQLNDVQMAFRCDRRIAICKEWVGKSQRCMSYS